MHTVMVLLFIVIYSQVLFFHKESSYMPNLTRLFFSKTQNLEFSILNFYKQYTSIPGYVFTGPCFNYYVYHGKAPKKQGRSQTLLKQYRCIIPQIQQM